MATSPTSRYLVAVATLVGLVLVGCAEPETGADEDAPEAIAKPKEPTTDRGANDPGPAFDPKFETPTTESTAKAPDPPKADVCIDNGDAGNVLSDALKLPDTDDCNNEYQTLTGIANGAADQDFYALSAADKPFCVRNTDFAAHTPGTELCVFARCKNSTADAVTGCAAGTPATNETGMKGCCATGPGSATPTWSCPSFTGDDSAEFIVRVRQSSAARCLPYKIKYRF